MRALFFLCLLFLPLSGRNLSLDRIVLIGASVSHGFHESEPLGGEKSTALRLDRYLEAALTVPHGKIINDANRLLFLNAEQEGGNQVRRLLQRQPTLVVGVDFLFWFLYGWPPESGGRLEHFERGLDLLSKIDRPLIVGDIPDASAAAGKMLARQMIPDPATIAAANRRLAEWAEKKGDVSIIPLSAFMKACTENGAVRTGLYEWKKGETRALLQPDHLHPDHSGCAALALAIMSAIADKGLPVDSIEWNPGRLIEKAAAPREPVR